MANGQYEAVLEPPRGFLDARMVAEVSDGQLLAQFAAHRDELAEAAFEVLVRRHGPMVLRVCQHVVGDRHIAEDAFQATFLILARRAGSIRQPELLGHWLHGVALRTAREARMRDDRRRRRESSRAEGIAGRTDRRSGPTRRVAGLPRGVRGPPRGGVPTARPVSRPGRSLRSGGTDVSAGGESAALPGGHDRRATEAGAGTAPRCDSLDVAWPRPLGCWVRCSAPIPPRRRCRRCWSIPRSRPRWGLRPARPRRPGSSRLRSPP